MNKIYRIVNTLQKKTGFSPMVMNDTQIIFLPNGRKPNYIELIHFQVDCMLYLITEIYR